ncbi:MAG: 30S ribosomal protein S12 methylthiotransferase RimO [Bacillota bacterium]
MERNRRVVLVSLGCSKNLVDSERMLGVLAKHGYQIVDDPQQADIVIVNTCGFIRDAKQESIDTILELAELKKERKLRLIVAGCLATRYSNELLAEMPEIDGLLGVHDIDLVVEAIERCDAGLRPVPGRVRDYQIHCGLPRIALTPKSYAYLKIAEGCNNRCSYCAIPLIRGAYRSMPMDGLVEEAQQLATRGVKELVIVAQDTTIYGQDIYGRPQLHQLLRRLSQTDVQWIRVMYAHPAHVYDEFLAELQSNPKVVKYLDLPAQHVSSRLLKLMNRPYSFEELQERLEQVRKHVPSIALRTTFMVGFPGETEREFLELLEFVEKGQFEHVGFFAYSREEGTPAASLPDQLKRAVKNQRLVEAHRIAAQVRDTLKRRHVGKRLRLLADGTGARGSYCRSYMQAPEVDDYVLLGRPLEQGSFVEATLTGFKGDYFEAQ